MGRKALAKLLIGSTGDQRTALLNKNRAICDGELAIELQQICYAVWNTNPQTVSSIRDVLVNLVQFTNDSEIKAYSEWVAAIGHLVNGHLEQSVVSIDLSEKRFLELRKPHEAAKTQTSKLYILALLGRYDEAIACGIRARDVFISADDIYSTGKIEHNIGNLYWRRDFYADAEPYLASAHSRFSQIDDHVQLAMVENCQAFVKALQNDFAGAEMIYASALDRAKSNDLTVTQAEIEIGLSNLYLFQGRLDLALEFLENARQKYIGLKMPHQIANCELEIAEIYLELNLLPEASEYYKKTNTKFSDFGMKAELARSFLNYGKTLFLLADIAGASDNFDKAQELFISEGNEIYQALTTLMQAQILLRQELFKEAEEQIQIAREIFETGGNIRFGLLSEWLETEVLIKQKKFSEAAKKLLKLLPKARENSRQIEFLTLVSLGITTKEEIYYVKAIAIVENSRNELNSEELRTSFFTEKLLPYHELVKLKIAQRKIREAFQWHERSRSRSLFDSVNSGTTLQTNDFELDKIQQEINWFYSRINRKTETGLEAKQEISKIRNHVKELEKSHAEVLRRSKIGQNRLQSTFNSIDIDDLQQRLDNSTLIEFVEIEGRISAFVINSDSIDLIDLESSDFINTETRQLLFQIKTARYQDKLSADSRKLAYQRLLKHSRSLYDKLIRPFIDRISGDSIKFVPTGILHYLPFQALHDGEKFLIESFEVAYSPSASIFQTLKRRQTNPLDSILLVGVSDSRIPNVRNEVDEIGKLFVNSVKLIDEMATVENVANHAADANFLHFACHASFRPDNPSYSALSLYSEGLTANDISQIDLRNKTVVLSACESGMNAIVPGEELIGLMRGFLASGTSTILQSLWTVHDRSALDLMTSFYSDLSKGVLPSKALQNAEKLLLVQNPHPYFWAPFVIVGK